MSACPRLAVPIDESKHMVTNDTLIILKKHCTPIESKGIQKWKNRNENDVEGILSKKSQIL